MLEDAYQITPTLSTEAVDELSTIRDILRWGVSQCEKAELYYGHGTDNAWDELPAALSGNVLICRLISMTNSLMPN